MNNFLILLTCCVIVVAEEREVEIVTLQNGEGEISSPSYPKCFVNNGSKSYSWTVSMESLSLALVSFLDFYMQPCTTAQLQIKYHDGISKYCENNVPDFVYFNREASIDFIVDEYGDCGRGFKLKYVFPEIKLSAPHFGFVNQSISINFFIPLTPRKVEHSCTLTAGNEIKEFNGKYGPITYKIRFVNSMVHMYSIECNIYSKKSSTLIGVTFINRYFKAEDNIESMRFVSCCTPNKEQFTIYTESLEMSYKHPFVFPVTYHLFRKSTGEHLITTQAVYDDKSFDERDEMTAEFKISRELQDILQPGKHKIILLMENDVSRDSVEFDLILSQRLERFQLYTNEYFAIQPASSLVLIEITAGSPANIEINLKNKHDNGIAATTRAICNKPQECRHIGIELSAPYRGIFELYASATNSLGKVTSSFGLVESFALVQDVYVASSKWSYMGETLTILVLYKCDSAEFKIKITDNGNVLEEVDIYNQTWKDIYEKFPRINFPFDPTDYKAYVKTHSFTSRGKHKIFAEVSTTNNKQSKNSTTEIIVSEGNFQLCLDNVEIRDGNDVNTAVGNVDVVLRIMQSVEVNFKCELSEGEEILYDWKIYQVDSLDETPKSSRAVLLDEALTSRNALVIGRWMLPLGLYVIGISVTVVSTKNTVEIQQATDYTSVQVTAVNLNVHICRGAVREIGDDKSQIIFDASCSHNPHINNVKYNWFCALSVNDLPQDANTGKFRRKGSCFGWNPLWFSSKKSVKLSTDSLDAEERIFVRLFLSHPEYEEVFEDQEIVFLRHRAPDVSIKCWVNCEKRSKPQEPLILQLECKTCIRYKWSTVIGQLPSCSSSSFCKISSKILQRIREQFGEELNITCQGFDVKGQNASVTFNTQIGRTPNIGNCLITPYTGKAYITLFNVSCHSQEKLLYTFLLDSNASSTDSLLQYGYESSITNIILPPGLSRIHIEVCDSNYSCHDDIILQVKVDPGRPPPGTSLTEQLNNAVKSSDSQKMTQLISVLAHTSLLNEDIRQKIITSIDRMKFSSQEAVKQIADVINHVTNEPDLISFPNKEVVLNKLFEIISWISNVNDSSSQLETSLVESSLFATSNILHSNDIEQTIPSSFHRSATQAIDQLSQRFLDNIVPGDKPMKLNSNSFTANIVRFNSETQHDIPVLDSDVSINISSQNVEKSKVVNLQVFRFNSLVTNFHTQTQKVDEVVGISLTKSQKNFGEMKANTDPIFPRKYLKFGLPNHRPSPTYISVRLNKTICYEMGCAVSGSVRISVEDKDVTSLKVRITSHDSALFHAILLTLQDSNILSTNEFRGKVEILGSDFDNHGGFTWTIPSTYLQGHSLYNLTISVQLNSSSPNSDVTVEVLSYATKCLYWNDVISDWSSEGCRSSLTSTLDEWIWCECELHQSTTARSTSNNRLLKMPMMFSSRLIVYPNKIDFNKVSWNLWFEFLENPIVISLVFGLFVFFGFLMVWAHHRDKKQLDVPPYIEVCDNLPNERYRYLVIVFTGNRRRAGTSATVALTIVGSKHTSTVHLLQKCGEKQILLQGSVVSFVMTSSGCLGNITAVRLWHDNSGQSPEWYVDRMVIRDIETNECWFFLVNTWLSDHMGSHKIDIVLSAATIKQLHSFHSLFTIKTDNNMRERHLWFSLFAMRPWSCRDMTRVQRVACCTLLIYMLMLTSLMFYGRSKAYEEVVPQLKLANYSFKWSNVAIGIESGLLCFPVTYIVTSLFRLSRLRSDRYHSYESKYRITSSRHHRDHVTSSNEKFQKSKRETRTRKREFDDIRNKPTTSSHKTHRHKPMKKYPRPSMGHRRLSVNRQLRHTNRVITVMDVDPGSVDYKPLPWFSVYIGWMIVLVVVVGCSVLSVMYGMTYGLAISKEWLVSLFSGFMQSVFFIEPFKVILLSYFIVVNNPRHDLTDWIPPLRSEVLLKSYKKPQDVAKKMKKDRVMNPAYKLPDVDKVKIESEERTRVRILKRRMKDLSVHFIYLSLLLIVAFGLRDNRSFQFRKTLKNMFTVNLKYVKTRDTVYDWLKGPVIDSLYGRHTSYFYDNQLLVISPPTIRQQRIEASDPCPHSSILHHDNAHQCKLASTNEEKEIFSPGWSSHQPDQNFIYYSEDESPWKYTPGDSTSLPFMGEYGNYKLGGYVAKLTTDKQNATNILQHLQDNNWIDSRTRIVMLETVVYNTAIRLFCLVLLAVEFPNVGNVHPTIQLMILKSHHVHSAQDVFVYLSLFGILGMVFYYIINIVNLARETGIRYLKNVWNLLEILTLLTSVAAAVVFLTKATYFDLALYATRHNMENYSLFYTSSCLGYTLTCLLSYCIFFTMLRTVSVMEGHPHFTLMAATFKQTDFELVGHFAFLFVAYVAFCHSGLILFKNILDFSSIVRAMLSVVAYAAGAYMTNLFHLHPVTGGFYLLVFAIFYVKILVNFYAVILENAFRESKLLLRDIKRDDFISFGRKQIRSLFAIEGKRRREKQTKLMETN